MAMTLLLPTTSRSMRVGSNVTLRCSRLFSSPTSSLARRTTDWLFMTCISLPRSCSQSPKIWRSGRSALWRSPRLTRMRPDEMYVVGVVSATVITVAVVMRNRPRMIHLRRKTTARNSRAVAWRLIFGAEGVGLSFTSEIRSLPDDARHVDAVEVEQLPADERGGEPGAERRDELLREHVDAADRGPRHEDDVEAAHDLVREIVAVLEAVQADARHVEGVRAVAVEQQHAVAR